MLLVVTLLNHHRFQFSSAWLICECNGEVNKLSALRILVLENVFQPLSDSYAGVITAPS